LRLLPDGNAGEQSVNYLPVRRAEQAAFEIEPDLEANLEEEERDGGACPICLEPARRIECWQCCDSVWMIECPHRAQPAPMRHGRSDGTDAHRVFCSDCSDPL
jgi:hypothetical protein